jgi:hypothetical protein
MKRIFLLLVILPCLASATIQAEIDAKAQSGGTVTLPADLTIDTPLVVPAGARNLTIQGAPGGTVMRPSRQLTKQAILVGNRPELASNWWITGASNIRIIGTLKTGAKQIQLDWTPQIPEPGYYVLWDDYKIVCAKGPNVNMNHAEVVQISAVDGPTRLATLVSGIGREYTGKVSVCPYQGRVCTRITIKGIRWDGKAPDGSVSEGLVAVGISDGVRLENLTATNFRSDAVMCNTARNVVMSGIQVSGASGGEAGEGYGISIYRSRFVSVSDSSATGCRHSYIVHSGSMDVSIRRCYTANGIDTHGYDERRIAILECSGDGGDLGNDAWLGGAVDVLISRCKFSEPIGLHANVRSVRIVDSTIGGLSIYSSERQTVWPAEPAEGYADRIRVDRCIIRGSLTTQGASRFGTLTMTGGAFERPGTLIDLADQPTTGRFLFSGVAFRAGPDQVIQLRNQGPGFVFQAIGCRFETMARNIVWASPTFLGQALFKDCVYPAGSTFIYDQSGRVQASGNTSEAAK